MEDEVQRNDDAPVAANAIEVPRNLFGQVAGPDDEELTEGEIDIQHHEGKGQLAQIVLFRLTQDGLEWLSLGQRNRHDDGESQYGVTLAYQEQKPVDR